MDYLLDPDQEKLFLDHVYALFRDETLFSIYKKFGIGVFRRSCVLRNFEKFLQKVEFKGKMCLEIGTLNGLTAIVLSRYFDEVISIDIKPTKEKYEILEFTGIKNIKFVDVKDNRERNRFIDKVEFDYAFSDANHFKETNGDFEQVAHCGRVLFDEYWEYQQPVFDLVNNLRLSGEVQTDWKFAYWQADPMDRFIKTMEGKREGNLVYCDGIAYQAEMWRRIFYDEEYFKHYEELAGSATANKINNGRIQFTNKHARGFPMLDIGIGSGEFIEKRGKNTFGYDINPKAVRWLKQRELFREDFMSFRAFTFWDVLEHVGNPGIYLDRIPKGAYLFTSLPIFRNLKEVTSSKHYKPGEHLYYWTEQGFIEWMRKYGFKLMDASGFEMAAGRESIRSFAFKRLNE